jgi:hypothetical protein
MAPALEVSIALSEAPASRSSTPPGLSVQRVYTLMASRSTSSSPSTHIAGPWDLPSGRVRLSRPCATISAPPSAVAARLAALDGPPGWPARSCVPKDSLFRRESSGSKQAGSGWQGRRRRRRTNHGRRRMKERGRRRMKVREKGIGAKRSARHGTKRGTAWIEAQSKGRTDNLARSSREQCASGAHMNARTDAARSIPTVSNVPGPGCRVAFELDVKAREPRLGRSRHIRTGRGAGGDLATGRGSRQLRPSLALGLQRHSANGRQRALHGPGRPPAAAQAERGVAYCPEMHVARVAGAAVLLRAGGSELRQRRSALDEGESLIAL